jgi:AbrB family looped-hinge helix DNA binding protein
MITTIDAAGRVVVPKSMRERLGLGPGVLIELRERDGRLGSPSRRDRCRR